MLYDLTNYDTAQNVSCYFITQMFKISSVDISFDTKVCFILNALIIWLIKLHILKHFFSNRSFSIEIFSVVSEKNPFVYSQ